MLDRCSWEAAEPSIPNISSRLGSTDSVWQNLLLMAPFREKLFSFLRYPSPAHTGSHRSNYAGVMAQSESLIQDPRIRFVFVHLPVPHPPGIYDRAHRAMRDHGTYLDNLVLADETLAKLRSVIQSTPTAAYTTLIVSSDHSWRTFLWKHSADWSGEGSHASRDGYDPRPVLIVSLPQNSGHVIAQPASALVVYGILQSLLRGQMRTTVDVRRIGRETTTGDE